MDYISKIFLGGVYLPRQPQSWLPRTSFLTHRTVVCRDGGRNHCHHESIHTSISDRFEVSSYSSIL